ncbi:M56 family metallopeptidase [Erythrobacter sp. W53]|uniref:M56 family metallopeptidase n=1 Tax=Erythrobacter sp. W53 TaxID=3425947 RepID=UPI003D769A3A
MIEALGLVQLWSLIVAGGAWYLQRDSGQGTGSRFPGPNVWAMLIWVSLLPGLIYLIPFNDYVVLPQIQGFEVEALRAEVGSRDGIWLPSLLMLYLSGAGVLMARTLWRWFRLQRLPLQPTAEPGVFSTSEPLPPLTLSWPKRVVVIPEGMEASPALIRHERAHLQHNDGELTLLFLLLHDALLRNPGMGFLIRQWRLAIELRADRAVTQTLSASDRRSYATLLLQSHRPTSGDGTSLPCPTAQLGASHQRSVKMRLLEIIENRSDIPKRNWQLAVVSASSAAIIVGLTTAAASAESRSDDRGLGTVGYITQTSPELPASCPDFETEDVTSERAIITVSGQRVPGYKVRLGTVLLRHDVRRDGSVQNPQVLNSTNRCFEAAAANALLEWMAEPQPKSLKGVVVKMHFGISGEDPNELKEQITGFGE